MYRNLLAVLVFVAALAAPSIAAPVQFYAVLDGPSESPPNPSPGTGTALVTIDAEAHTMRLEAAFMDLVSGVTASHIHVMNGPGDTNTGDTLGPVATTTPSFAGFPSGVTSGVYDSTFDMTLASSYRPGWITDSGGTPALAEAELFAGIIEGRAYLNIHTSTSPAGEIRGFLLPIPEPATWWLAMVGLAALVSWRRMAR